LPKLNEKEIARTQFFPGTQSKIFQELIFPYKYELHSSNLISIVPVYYQWQGLEPFPSDILAKIKISNKLNFLDPTLGGKIQNESNFLPSFSVIKSKKSLKKSLPYDMLHLPCELAYLLETVLQ